MSGELEAKRVAALAKMRRAQRADELLVALKRANDKLRLYVRGDRPAGTVDYLVGEVSANDRLIAEVEGGSPL